MNKLNINQNEENVVVYIPFDGFYNSILSESLDFEIEQMIEEGDVAENYFDKVDFRASYLAIAKTTLNSGYTWQVLKVSLLNSLYPNFSTMTTSKSAFLLTR